MKTIFTLFKKDCLCFIKDKTALVLTFVVPMVLIYIFGFVFGLNKKDPGPSGIRMAVVNLSSDPAAADLVEALKAEKTFRVIDTHKTQDGVERPISEEEARSAIRQNRYNFALILPKDMISAERFGLRFAFISNPRNEIETQTVQGMLQKVLFSKVPELLGRSLQLEAKRIVGGPKMEKFNRAVATQIAGTFGGDPEEIFANLNNGGFGFESKKREPVDPSLRRLDMVAKDGPKSAEGSKAEISDLLSSIIKIDNEKVAGNKVKNPMASRMVGGYAIMFLLFAINGSMTSLFEEKKTGIFARLLSGPVRASHIIWSKFCFGIALGLVQLSALFIAGHLLYDLELPKYVLPLFAVALCASAACSSFGMLICAIARTPAAAHGLSTFLVLTMSSIGGAWFPVSFMPEFIQQLARFTVVFWSVEGFTDVLWAGKQVLELLPTLGVLCAIAIAAMTIAQWRFRKNGLFE